ncbi:MAG: ribosome small subunit-dependent GTPase, partial [Sedimenticolaceae bacterium]
MARRRLSEQQKARIAGIQQKRRQRAEAKAEQTLGAPVEAKQQVGRVVVRHGRSLLIRPQQGGAVHGMLRANLGEVVCGDRVVWQPTGDNEGVVVAVQPRT